jgi:hypothetical protein
MGWVELINLDWGNIVFQGIKNIKLINLPINWPVVIGLGIFFLIYSEIYSWLEKGLKWWHFILFFPINLILWFFLTPQIIGLIGISKEITYNTFFGNVVNGVLNNYLIIIGFAVATAIIDQILHWLLFGREKSKFTLVASMSGTLLDELSMRLLLLGILLSFGLDIPTAIFLQGLSYVIYYMDPTSKNRMKKASLNLMHGIILGTITLTCGWIATLSIVWIREIMWLIENMISK